MDHRIRTIETLRFGISIPHSNNSRYKNEDDQEKMPFDDLQQIKESKLFILARINDRSGTQAGSLPLPGQSASFCGGILFAVFPLILTGIQFGVRVFGHLFGHLIVIFRRRRHSRFSKVNKLHNLRYIVNFNKNQRSCKENLQQLPTPAFC